MRTLKELLHTDIRDMTKEEKKVAKDLLAAMCTVPVYTLSADGTSQFDIKETEKEFKENRKVFKF